MGLFNFKKEETKQVDQIQPKESTGSSYDLGATMPNNTITLSVELQDNVVREKNGTQWVDYGINNLYPEFLKSLYNSSPTHQSIVKTKALMVAGNGYSINDQHLSEQDKINVAQVVNQVDNQIMDTTLDMQIYGAFAYEIIWSLDFSKIIKINRIDPSKLRAGKFKNGIIDVWYYKNNWSNRQEPVREIYSFLDSDCEHYNQLLYIPISKVSNMYYGDPNYNASIQWISLESKFGTYYNSVMENGFNPGMVVKFYKKPANNEEKNMIMSGLTRMYAGLKNINKLAVTWSDGKELAPDFMPLNVNNLDKQYIVLADQVTAKIVTGHGVLNRDLFLPQNTVFSSSEFNDKTAIFYEFRIKPEQKLIENTINEILLTNGYSVNFKINKHEFESTASNLK